MIDQSAVLARMTRRALFRTEPRRSSALPMPSSDTLPVVADQIGETTRRLGQLRRRAGFGATPAEFAAHQQLGVEASTERLLNFSATPDAAEEKLAGETFDFTKVSELQRWWLLRLRYTTRPLQEKMVLYWHGLLTSGASDVGNITYLKNQNELFRANPLGKYDQMLKAISKDPAMMLWLDIANSSRRAPNENFARELMELFTLGEGNFTEPDVKAAARAFTGWRIDQSGNSYFDVGRYDGGTRTFLGRTGNWTADDIIDIIMGRPETPPFVVKRLFRFFVHDDPSAETISRLTTTFTSSNHDVGAVVRDILTGPEFFSAAAFRALIKSPVEYVIMAIRNLGLETDGKALPNQLSRLSQQLFNPPNVAGWPGGATWIANTTFFNRLNFADGLVRPTNAYAGPLAPADLVTTLDLKTAGAVVDYFLDRFLEGAVAPGTRDVIVAYASDGKGADAPIPGNATSRDRRIRGVAYLILATPEFHLN